MPQDRNDARALLDEVERARTRSRAETSVMWFPLLLFGVFTVVGAAVVARYGGAARGLYWMVAGPVGAIAVGVVAWLRQRRVGADPAGGPYVAVAVLILVGASLTGWLGDVVGEPVLSAVGPPLVVSLGYLLFARLERTWMLAWVAAGLAVLTFGLWATGLEPRPLTAILAGAYGGAFMVTGLLLLWRRRRR